MRILIFGNSGSGKTSLARLLAARDSLFHLDLDSIVWKEGEIAAQRPAEEVAARLDQFLAEHESWVIEGCYGDLVERVAPRCTILVFLNPGLKTCLVQNLNRPWEPHKYASLQEQNAMLDVLQAWVEGYYDREDAWSYKCHRRVFDEFFGTKVECLNPSEYKELIASAFRRSEDERGRNAFESREP